MYLNDPYKTDLPKERCQMHGHTLQFRCIVNLFVASVKRVLVCHNKYGNSVCLGSGPCVLNFVNIFFVVGLVCGVWPWFLIQHYRLVSQTLIRSCIIVPYLS